MHIRFRIFNQNNVANLYVPQKETKKFIDECMRFDCLLKLDVKKYQKAEEIMYNFVILKPSLSPQ